MIMPVINLGELVVGADEVWMCKLWRHACWLFLAELVILGPKCKEASCVEPATHVVHWPTGSIECCDRHTAAWRNVAERGLGMHLHVERVYYETGEDAAVQRFRAMEMD